MFHLGCIKFYGNGTTIIDMNLNTSKSFCALVHFAIINLSVFHHYTKIQRSTYNT